jgi:hypothetical protein
MRANPTELIVLRANDLHELYQVALLADEPEIAAVCADEIAFLRALLQDLVDELEQEARITKS